MMENKRSTAICVLGMHRSGTSLMSGILNHLGVYFGENADLISPRKDNPEGFWELSEIVSFHETLLKELLSNTNNTIPIQNINFKNKILQPYKKILRGIINRYFARQAIWGWKDPRTCIFLPLWIEVLDEMDIDIKFIIQFRNPVDVANSLEKRNGLSRNRSFRSWFLHNLYALKWSTGYQRLPVNYDTLLANKELVIGNVAEFLKINNWEDNNIKQVVSGFVKKDLRHSFTSYEDVIQMVPRKIANLYKKMLRAEMENDFLERDEFLAYINSELVDYINYSKLFSDGLQHEAIQDYFAIEVFEPSSLNWDKYLDSNGIICDGAIRTYTMQIPCINSGYFKLHPVNFPATIDIYSIDLYRKDDNKKVYEWNKNNNYNGLELQNQLIKVKEGHYNSLKLLSTGFNPTIHLHHNIEKSSDLYLLKITMSVSKPFVCTNVTKQDEYLMGIYNKLKNAENMIGEILVKNAKERSIFIWGTGVGGETTLNLIKDKSQRILGLIDNDPNKWGHTFYGYKVFSPEVLKSYCNTKPYIIIGSMYYEEICKQIKSYGFNEVEDYSVNFYLLSGVL